MSEAVHYNILWKESLTDYTENQFPYIMERFLAVKFPGAPSRSYILYLNNILGLMEREEEETPDLLVRDFLVSLNDMVHLQTQHESCDCSSCRQHVVFTLTGPIPEDRVHLHKRIYQKLIHRSA